MGYDPEGTLDWGTFFSGGQLALSGLVACATAMTVVSEGACAGLMVFACVTFFAGEVTVLNGVSEVIESVTDYNPMRDTVYAGDEHKYETQKTVYAEAAEVGTAALTLASSFDVCFQKGTVISAEEGVLPIESICEGMQVWAADPETGETALKRVLRLFRGETSEWIHLTVDGEEIVCTPGHPFYSPVRGWVAACKLRAGDILVTLNGDFVVLEKVQHELLENPEITYNFEVEGFHTYYVGESRIFVHNLCKQELVAGSKKGWNARVSVGGEANHKMPHAHVFWKNSKLASVDVGGNLLAGSLDGKGLKFVKNNIIAIAEGIRRLYG